MLGITRERPEITDAMIQEIAGPLTKAQRAQLIERNWEDVPDGDYDDVRKIGFVLASIPHVGDYNIDVIQGILIERNRTAPVPKNYSLAKPVLYHKLWDACPDAVRTAAWKVRNSRNMPDWIAADGMWCVMTVLPGFVNQVKSAAQVHARTAIESAALVSGVVDDPRRLAGSFRHYVDAL